MEYILGGGIAGLIYAFYNPNCTIITKKVGGQFNFKFPLGPRFLKVNDYSKKLLKDLGIKYRTKKVKVGYYYDNGIHNKIKNQELVERYFEKSRGIKYTKDETLMNSSLNEFEAFNIDINKIINSLKRKLKNRIIDANIITVNLERKELVISGKIGTEFLTFDKIISTIPKDIFYKMINCKKDFYSSPITYALLNKFDLDLHDYDFVYFPENVFKFHRITKTSDNLFVAELFGIYNSEELKKIFGENLINKIILNNSQIISEEEQESFDNIKFFGRYGTWNRTWKIEKCVKEAIENGSQ